MARMDVDHDETVEGRRRTRRFRLLPRVPRIQRGEMRPSVELQKLRAGIRATRHTCPQDDTSMELLDVYPIGADGEVEADSDPFRALVCPTCSYTVPVAIMRERFRREAEPLKRAERQFTLFGFGILVVFGGITLMTGNVFTIIGALLLSLTLFMKALFYRYRHWQAKTGQMFQDQVPLRAWLRAEFSKSA